MEKIPRLSQEQRENLTAYLDGELEDSESQDIETALTRSSIARHEVDILGRTWDMLNILPRAKVSEEFTRKTLTQLRAIDQKPRSLDSYSWYQRTRQGSIFAAWAAGLLIVASIGFVATRRWVPNETEELMTLLPILERLDEYQAVESIEFLKELKKSSVFAVEEPGRESR
jgi:anti-sigma factor RsiW